MLGVGVGVPVDSGQCEAELGECGWLVGGQQSEVGTDLGGAADPGAASAMVAAHQVSDLAFHLRSGGPVLAIKP